LVSYQQNGKNFRIEAIKGSHKVSGISNLNEIPPAEPLINRMARGFNDHFVLKRSIGPPAVS